MLFYRNLSSMNFDKHLNSSDDIIQHLKHKATTNVKIDIKMKALKPRLGGWLFKA